MRWHANLPAGGGVAEGCILQSERKLGFVDAICVQSLDRPLVAGTVELTGRRGTLVDVDLAVLPGVAFPALASVVFDFVNAGRVVQAGVDLAVVDVVFAVLALEAGVGTVATIRVHPV